MKERNKLAVKLIKTYQKHKKVIGVGHCKFYPTCSNYAIETYQKFNFFKASLLVMFRIMRCNYFTKRKYDPVKLTKKEKQDKSYLYCLKKILNDDFIDYILSLSNITCGIDLYCYIYDYYYLPSKVSKKNDQTKKIVTNRYFITNKMTKVNHCHNQYAFDYYLKIATCLYERGFINTKPIETLIVPTDLSLVSYDELSINEILEKEEISEGIIIINNYEERINYLDFEELLIPNLNHKEFEKLKAAFTKLIIKTNTSNILPFLSDLRYSINVYTEIDELNAFYHLNKRN